MKFLLLTGSAVKLKFRIGREAASWIVSTELTIMPVVTEGTKTPNLVLAVGVPTRDIAVVPSFTPETGCAMGIHFPYA